MRNMNVLRSGTLLPSAVLAGSLILSACGTGKSLIDAIPTTSAPSSSTAPPGKSFEVEFDDLNSGRPLPTYKGPSTDSGESGLTYNDGETQLAECYIKGDTDRSDPLPGNAEVTSDYWFRLEQGDYISGVWVILNGRLDEMSTCSLG